MSESNQMEKDTIVTDDVKSAENTAENKTNDTVNTEADTENHVVEDITTLTQQRDTAQAKADENWDQCVRLQAEMDNLRKRSSKQVGDAHKFAAQKIVEALLPMVDSLEMGMQAEGDLDSIREGMSLTMQQFESVMEKFNIVAVNPMGDVFNPDLHQAMSMQPCENQENNTISMVMQKGYTLNGRLIRPAMVMVCKNS